MNTTPQQPADTRQVRSDGLLPAETPDPSLEVAEEVAFDQQSERARAIGAMPPDVPAGSSNVRGPGPGQKSTSPGTSRDRPMAESSGRMGRYSP